MKLTKKLEAEALKFYKAYWDCYLNGDMKTLASMLDDNITIFGTAVSEVFKNKKDAIKFYKKTADQLTGKTQFRNRQIDLSSVDDTILVNEKCDLYFLLEKKWTYYGQVRVTAVIKQINKAWKLVQQHASFPDMRADEGEQLAAEKIKEENIQLRDAVKRRTIELEEKNRELEIESAVERVRAKALAMHKSEEIIGVLRTLYKEINSLNIAGVVSATIYLKQDDNRIRFWDLTTLSEDDDQFTMDKFLPLDVAPDHLWFRKMLKAKRKYFIVEQNEKDLKLSLAWVRKIISKEVAESVIGFMKSNNYKTLWHPTVRLANGLLNLDFVQSPPEEIETILLKMGAAFDLAYKRFLDLKKAEAQTREAQIQLSVERVRAKALAMHRSDEISDVANIMRNELGSLNIPGIAAATITLQQDKDNIRLWDITSVVELKDGFYFNMDFIFNLKDTRPTDWIRIIWDSKEKYFVYKQDKKKFKRTLEWTSKYDPEFAKTAKEFLEKNKIKASWHPAVPLSHGKLSLDLLQEPVAEVEFILTKMAAAFDLAYQRFLDLQKAEAQAREAQIQLSLERVRARAMAMYHSDELNDVLSVLFQQFDTLGIDPVFAHLSLFDLEKNLTTLRITGKGGKRSMAQKTVPIDAMDEWKEELNNWKKSKPSSISRIYYKKEVVPQIWDFFGDLFDQLPADSKIHPADFPNGLYCIQGNTGFGYIGLNHTREASEEEKNIILRFATEFGRVYQRFLDLQKAEAQAREAQIEVALERVRAASMAMHDSKELVKVATILYHQLISLGFDNVVSGGFNFPDEANNLQKCWLAESGDMMQDFAIKLSGDWVLDERIVNRKKNISFFEQVLRGKEVRQHLDYLFPPEFETPEVRASKDIMPVPTVFAIRYLKEGYMILICKAVLSEEQKVIIDRFASVFNLAYTRFLDLQKAEAQTREAQIEVAVERVRAKALAMHKSEDMHKVVVALKKELTGLHIPNITAATIYLEQDDGSVRILDLSDTGEVDDDKPQLQLDKIFRLEDTDPDLWVRRMWNRSENYFVIEADEADFARAVEFIKTIDPAGAEMAEKIIKEKGIKKAWLPTVKLAKGVMNIDLLEPPSHEVESILLKMGAGFDLAYKRFLDLQKAEAQAREAQIEAALERVRSRTMAMHHSNEIADIVGKIFTELKTLDLVLNRVLIWIFNDREKFITWWSANPETESNAESYKVDYNEQQVFLSYLHAWQKRVPLYLYTLSGDNKKNWEDHLFSNTELSKLPAAVRNGMREEGTIFTTSTISDYGLMMVGSFKPLSNENTDIIQRFGRVFQQSYTRYLDVQKAEAQARESQIETALERVRAVAMAMRKPEELMQISKVIYEQLFLLGFSDVRNVQIAIDDDDERKAYNGVEYSEYYQNRFKKVPYNSSPLFAEIAKEIKKSNNAFYQKEISGKEFEDWKKWRTNIQDREDSHVHPGLASATSMCFYLHSVGTGMLGISTFSPIRNEQLDILKRFKNVFELSYRRYIDIEKAEAQAREAQIELALERVRARTMAMHRSEELAETAQVMFHQLNELGGAPDRISIGVVDEAQGVVNFWTTDQIGSHINNSFSARLNEKTVIEKTYKAWKENKKSLVIDLQGDELKEWIRFAREEMNILVKEDHIKNRRIHNLAFFSHGWILVTTHEPQSAETIQILERFASVFNLTYRRFLDLQKAEAQAKESQIQLALERVRSRAMAMQSSDELKELISTVFTELTRLDLVLTRCVIMIYDGEAKSSKWWMANSEDPDNPVGFYIKPHDYAPMNAYFKAWHERKLKYTYELKGQTKKDWDDFLFTETELKNMPGFVIEGMKAPDLVYLNASFNNFGNLTLASLEPLSDEHFDILLRFAKVFDLTYTRFSDLKQAEAQARESQIQLALERVRARTMAMQKSDELPETSHILYEQMKELGEPVEQLTIGVVQEENNVVEISATLHGDILKKVYQHSIDEPFMMSKIYDAWKTHQKTLIVELKGDELNAYNKYRNELTRSEMFPTDLGDEHRRIVYAAFYSKGMLALGANEPRPPESLQLLERFAGVFDQAYIRFIDLKNAEAQAREARIESALEKVRSRSLAMHKSDELQEVANILFDRLSELDIEMDSCNIAIFKEGTRDYDYWIASPFQKKTASFRIMGDWDFAIIQHLLKARESGQEFFSKCFSLEEKNKWFEFAFEKTDFVNIPPDRQEYILAQKAYALSIAFAKNTGVQVNLYSGNLPSEKEKEILIRFSKVFEQAYIRFLDLEKAETQAREAQIETALERVRASSMAMHRSNDLQEVIKVVTDQLLHLGFKFNTANFAKVYEDGSWDLWLSTPEQIYPDLIYVPYLDHPIFNHLKGKIATGVDSFTDVYGKEETRKFFEHFFENTIAKHAPESRKQFVMNSNGFARSLFLMKDLWLAISNYEGIPYTEEENAVFKRFAKVFEQAYIRFLDLQKAEAQAREAQIEAALERVRSSSLAMHKSEELKDVVKVVFENFRSLGLQNIDSVNINIFHEGSRDFDLWLAAPGQDYTTNFHLPYYDHPIANDFFNAVKKGEHSHKGFYDFDIKNEYFRYMFENSDNKHLPEERKQLILNGKAYSVSTAISKHSSLFIHNYSGETFSEETNNILVRFSKVFDQAYTRFLDLKKAELQAREAQIETGLERVRSKTMAMHKSSEVTGIAVSLNEELLKLGFEGGSTIIIINKETGDTEQWTGFSEDKTLKSCIVPFFKHPYHDALIDNWKKGERFLIYTVSEIEKPSLDDHYFSTGYKDFPESDKEWMRAMKTVTFSHAYMKYGAIHWGPDHLSEEQLKILERFSKVFEQSYTRFLDLQKAEAQAKEAQIEAALEKVRARTMGMQKSDELPQAASLLFQQIHSLGMPAFAAGYCIWDDDKQAITLWMSSEGILQPPFKAPTTEDELFIQMRKGYEAGKELHVVEMGGQGLVEHYQYMRTLPVVGEIFDSILKAGHSLPTFQVMHQAYFSKGFLLIITYEPVIQSHDIFKRFASVFDQTYTRFLDLKKAEAQAREAQIEAGLERVRARTMAMHSSDDVSAATATMFTELEKLGIQNLRGGITIISPDQTQEVWAITNLPDGTTIRSIGVFDMRLHPFWQHIFKGWENKESYSHYWLGGNEKEHYISILNATPNYLAQPIKEFPDMHVQCYFFGEGAVWANSLQPHTEEDKQIMKRFASVFSLTFRRYQDLKKAEAQAREAQIEAALERVRSKAMAMHKTEDLNPAVSVVFEELEKLDLGVFRCGISILNKEKRTGDIWVTSLDEGSPVQVSGGESFDIHPLLQGAFEAWLNRSDFSYVLKGDDLTQYYKAVKDADFHLPKSQTAFKEQHCFTTTYGAGGLFAFRETEFTDEAKKVMRRFANVFDLTYKRFLDLQKAEANAREATVEAALEKVRGKAMAMHNSNDLSVTTSMIISELKKLGISPIRCGVGIIDKETHKAQLYTARTSAEGDSLSVVGWVLLKGHPVLENIYDAFVRGEDYFPELMGDSMRSYYEQLLAGLSVPLPDFKDEQKHYGYFFSVSVGCLYAWSDVHYSDDQIKILRRFASIIDLTFRRYFELQKSEANAREAVKQAALDRVRADIASMRTIEDLDRITPLIWNELTILGIPFIRCGVFIMDDAQQLIHTFLSTPDGKAIGAFHLPYDTPGNIRSVLTNWREKRKYIDHWDEKEFFQFGEILVQQGALDSAENYLKTIPKGGFDLHFLPFLQGMLYVGNTSPLNEEQIELIQHVADAFSTAYARYEDFNRLEAAKKQVENTLTDLKQAQQQLVQSEKMASLGELTAGIAHEIQNPLNFVNNFSEVSKELIDEMKEELATGNKQQAVQIAEDIIQNLEKINHHGKRADAIVKSMLQHSRSSSGKKEPTDINALADEYLRLAYHGLRAKDKSFNAKFETAFDNSIGNVNIISQDIGRVLVNLINNAFYAVSERKKQETNGYEPTVEVLTKRIDDKIEIKVKDNGNGIPQKVLDKIFQPFFTTKPTGQGTGLGLSLAYDIVTKGHNGELKVETKEGEGSEFIIQLPAN